MELRINIVEAAAEIAEKLVKESFKTAEEMYQTADNGDTYYTDEAQERFENWYNEVWDILINAKTENLNVKN